MATSVSRNIYASEIPTQILGNQTQILGNQEITLKPNAKHRSFPGSILSFLDTQEGVFRFGQLSERIPKFVNAVRREVGLSRWAPLDDCTRQSVAAWSWLTTVPRAITMTPGMAGDVQEALRSCGDKSMSFQQKRYAWEKATREVTDTAAMYAYSAANVASLFPSLSKFGASVVQFAETSTTIHDGFSLKINVENLANALACDASEATPEIQETLKGTIRYNMIATAKDIVAFVSGMLGIYLLATGTALVPSIAFVTMSLASTVFAVIRKLYEDSMSFKPISFLDHRSVTQVTA